MSGATSRSKPKVFQLDYFARDSRASEVLATRLNNSGDAKLISKLSRHFNQFTAGLNDIMPCQNSTQGILFDMWTERFIASGRVMFEESFKQHDIEYSYYINVLHARRSRAIELGPLWQKMT